MKGRDSALHRLRSAAFPGNTFSCNPVYRTLETISHHNPKRSGLPFVHPFLHFPPLLSSDILSITFPRLRLRPLVDSDGEPTPTRRQCANKGTAAPAEARTSLSLLWQIFDAILLALH